MTDERRSAYAEAGVDYQRMKSAKELFGEISRATAHFAEGRGVRVLPDGNVLIQTSRRFLDIAPIIEGLGNKTRIAQRKYREMGDPDGYRATAICNIMMAVIDVLRQKALPVVHNAFIAVGPDAWFSDMEPVRAYAKGCFEACKMAGMAFVQGESQADKYVMPMGEPRDSAPLLAGSVIGLPDPFLELGAIAPGDSIIAVPSTGAHANGISLLIQQADARPNGFQEELNGRTIWDHALEPTACYVGLVEELANHRRFHDLRQGELKGIIPITGGGLTALIKYNKNFSYRIERWFERIPPIFDEYLLRRCRIPVADCLTTFNWGMGLAFIIAPGALREVMAAGMDSGLVLEYVGKVEEKKGTPVVIFEPEDGLELEYPG